jgi:hypothetical protein
MRQVHYTLTPAVVRATSREALQSVLPWVAQTFTYGSLRL